jgi:nitroreductase
MPIVNAPPSSDLKVLAAWAPELADTFVALSCDIALVLDAQGRIVRLSQHEARPIAPTAWTGQPWRDTVADDSRDKIDAMLEEAASGGMSRRREVNHPDAVGGPAPVAYSAARLGHDGPTLAIGHDLRLQVELQQRFVAAQEALERSYWHAQSRWGPSSAEPAAIPAPPAPAERMTLSERRSLGLDDGPPDLHDLDDTELVRALGHLVERIEQGALPDLLRDARHLAERHFLQRALQRVGSEEALARALGVSRRALTRRGTTSGPRRKG